MFKPSLAMFPLGSLLFAACTGSSGPSVEPATGPERSSTEEAGATETAPSATTAAAEASAPAAASAEGLPCGATVRSTLPGVQLEFPDQPCTLTAAQAQSHSFPWTLVVSEAPGELHHTTLHHCEGLRESGFHPRERLYGNQQSYEIADGGRCAPQDLNSAPKAGTFPESFAWDGVNWSGPSDFGNPKGEPFPAGTYTFAVELRGTTADGTKWEIVGELPFQLTGSGNAAPKRGEGPGNAPAEPVSSEPKPAPKPIIKTPLNREEAPPTPG